jgi:hypothetical protein
MHKFYVKKCTNFNFFFINMHNKCPKYFSILLSEWTKYNTYIQYILFCQITFTKALYLVTGKKHTHTFSRRKMLLIYCRFYSLINSLFSLVLFKSQKSIKYIEILKTCHINSSKSFIKNFDWKISFKIL